MGESHRSAVCPPAAPSTNFSDVWLTLEFAAASGMNAWNSCVVFDSPTERKTYLPLGDGLPLNSRGTIAAPRWMPTCA